MTVTSSPAAVPQEIAEAVILPAGFADLDGVVHPACRWLRSNAPLAKVQVEGYDSVWLMSKHAQIREVMRDTDTFVSRLNNWFLTTTAGDDLMRSMLDGKFSPIDNWSPMDPPEHTEHRGAHAHAFSLEEIRKYEPRIRELATEKVDAMLAAGTTCDAVAGLARDYPLQVVMGMLSVPERDFPLMHRMTQETFGGDDPDIAADREVERTPETFARMWMEAVKGFYDYFEDMRISLLENPRQDLASAIVNGRLPDGELMTPARQNGMVSSIALAGHDTVTSAIASGLHCLATHPDQFALVKSDPSLIPGLVEEALRWATPARHFMRTAVRDVEFHGQRLKAGDRMMCLFISGNYDEDVFPDPYRFDVTRRPNPHLSFGFGPHICLGIHVARLEMRFLFEELLSRIDSLELAGEPRYKQGNFVGGLKTLPIAFTPA